MRSISVNETSKIIKRTLTKAFPHTKFSVRLDKYSMGCSIDASWVDGPTDKQVKRILDRFDGKGFDGMTDMSYDCGERIYLGEKVDFRSGYVHGNRRYSAGFMRAVADRIAYDVGCTPPEIHPQYGHFATGHDIRVPYQFWDHWLSCGDTPKDQLTMADIEGYEHILAHDSYEGEYLTRLIDKVMACTSLEPEQVAVDLPEYIDINEDAKTGRASFEEPHKTFAGHEELEKAQSDVPTGFISDKAWSQ